MPIFVTAAESFAPLPPTPVPPTATPTPIATNIELVGQSGGDASDVFVQGVYAYVAGGARSGLRVIDVSNPAAPIEVGSHATPGPLDSVYVSGSYAYMGGSLGLRVMDVGNPAAPVEVGSYATPESAENVYVSGQYAYLAAGVEGLSILRMRWD